jgi:branched-chain amino acid transport system permease protein
VMPDPLLGMLVGISTATVLGALCSATILRGTDLTRLMVTLGVGLILMELANKLDWLTGGADGLQGVVMGPLLGQFEFDISGRTAAWYSISGAADPVCAVPAFCQLAVWRHAQGHS